MASLNLVPNAGLLAAQAGIFLANMVVIKKLMIDPYLKLKDKRQALTTGGQEEAEKILKDCELKGADLEAKITRAREDAKVLRQNSKADADTRQNQTLEAARKEAAEIVEKLRKELSENLRAEKEKIPQVVQKLSEDVYFASLR